MSVPGGESVSNGLLADLVFGHRRDLLVMHEQPIDIECFGAGGVRRLELNRFAALRVGDSGE